MENVKGHRFLDASGDGAAWVQQLPAADQDVDVDNLNLFFKLMYERQEIWYKRSHLNQPAPWTENPILRDYKYTNVYRELDRASQWMIKNILNDNSLTVVDLIWRIIIFRFFNQPDTFNHPQYAVELPHYDEFCPDKMWEQVVTYREKVDNPWHTAYLMNIAFVKKPADWTGRGLFKDGAYVRFVFAKIHAAIPKLAITLIRAKRPEEIIAQLEKLPAVAGFQSHEFYVDFTYVARYWKKRIMKFNENDYTNVGPGASLGLRLIFPSLNPKEQKEGIYWLRDLSKEQLEQYGDFKYITWSRQFQKYTVYSGGSLTLHAMEMWLCEFSKYWKMLQQAGKQRSKFVAKTKIC